MSADHQSSKPRVKRYSWYGCGMQRNPGFNRHLRPYADGPTEGDANDYVTYRSYLELWKRYVALQTFYQGPQT